MALTKAQIQSKINSLTIKKNNCENRRSSYKTSLTYANKLLNNLNSSISQLNSSNDYLKRFFTINNKTADGGKIEKVKSEINQIIKKLNNTIIPDINSNINSLTGDINYCTREINELVRQRQNVEM